ncbi:hypothetical protein H5410_002524 [Solanum commersonii]|uniref:Uncharacterized protein n=1 Tax=Solanum commersonii TaxID=4109 RepID=A0A9J6B330_SOLCO|nr:hypothetical protein H5410_002524 [Solanum commersonii]
MVIQFTISYICQGPNIPCASSIVNIQLKSTILRLTLLRLQANLSRELITEKILLYNLSLIDTSHTQKQLLSPIPVQHKLLGKKDIASNQPLQLTAQTTPKKQQSKLKQITTKED